MEGLVYKSRMDENGRWHWYIVETATGEIIETCCHLNKHEEPKFVEVQ
jgi:hypothetical protein